MKCRKCDEVIEQGEGQIPEEVGNGKYIFFHIGCYVQRKAERLEAEMQAQAQLARTVH